MVATFRDVCDVRKFGPNANSKAGHMGTVRADVEMPDGSLRRVHVLFYDDGRIRFRVNETPTVIEEAWLSGNRPETFSIIGLAPLGAEPRANADESVDE
ncbi:MAG: hypothetical protein WD556_02625 [Actinomycetota bacterium]